MYNLIHNNFFIDKYINRNTNGALALYSLEKSDKDW